MDFRDYAARETSALLAKLLAAQADMSAQQIAFLKEAVDAAAQAAADAAAGSVPESEIEALVGRLQGAAASDLDRVHQEAEAQAAGLRAEIQREKERADAAESDLDATIDAHKQVDAARMEAEAAAKKAEAAGRKEAAAREAAEKELGDVRGMLRAARAETSRLNEQLDSDSAQSAIVLADLTATRDSLGKLEKSHEALQRAHNGLQRDHKGLQEAHGSLEATHASLERSFAALDASRASIESAHGALGAEHARLEATRAALAGEHAHLQTSHAALGREHADLRSSHAALDASHANLQGAHSVLEGQHAHLQASHREMEGNHAALQGAHKDLEANYADLHALHGALEGSYANLQGSYSGMETGHTALLAAHASLEDSHAALKALHEEREASYARLQAAHAELQANDAKLEASHSTVEGNYTALRASHTALEAAFAKIQEAHGQAEAALAGTKKELAAATQAKAAVEAALKDARTLATSGSSESTRYRAAMEEAAARVAHLEAEIESKKAEHARRGSELRAAETALASVQGERETNAERLDTSTRRITALQRELDARDEAIRQLEAQVNDSVRTEAQFQQKTAGAGAELAGARQEIAALSGHVERLALLVDTSVRALDDLSAAGSVADLLASLVRQLSKEFPRVALFRVKGTHLEGEQQVGFDASTDVKKLMVPLTLDSLITRAASTGAVQHVTGKDLTDSSRAPFGGAPATAIALPLSFQGEPLAVAYADSDEASDTADVTHQTGAGFAKLLGRHCAVLLTRLAQEQRTVVELREYATMLLQEAEQIFVADLEGGRQPEERRKRLKENLDYARQLWAQRTSVEGPTAAGLMDEQIASIVQSQAANPFARELASLGGHGEARKKTRKTAS